MRLRFTEFEPGVYFSADPNSPLSEEDIAWLKQQALASPKGRARLCCHSSDKGGLHEMLIVLHRSSYIRPHRHTIKHESAHIIEGKADSVLFTEQGEISRIIRLEGCPTPHSFYYRITEPIFHTFVVHSEFLVFHETTTGPFERTQTEFAAWSPPEQQPAEAQKFMKQLAERVLRYNEKVQ